MTDTADLVLGFKRRAAQVMMKYAASCVFDDLDNPGAGVQAACRAGHDETSS